MKELLDGRLPVLSDISDLLCRPEKMSDAEEDPVLHRRLWNIAIRGRQIFQTMVEEILFAKEEEERKSKSKTREARKAAVLRVTQCVM